MGFFLGFFGMILPGKGIGPVAKTGFAQLRGARITHAFIDFFACQA